MGIFRTNDPTQFDDVDGIIIDETAPPPNTQGVAANIAILIGLFQRGPATLEEPGSTPNLLEQFGKSTFSGNKQLSNKKFGRLRIVRVIASDAVKATLTLVHDATPIIKFDAKGKGLYGNKIKVSTEDSTDDVAQVITGLYTGTGTGFDVSGAGEHWLFDTPDTNYYVWHDVTDGGNTQTDPNVGGRTGIKVSIIDADDASAMAGKARLAIDAVNKVTATVDTATVTVASDEAGVAGSPLDVDSSVSVAVTVLGVEGGTTYKVTDTNPLAVLPAETYLDLKITDITASTFAGSKLVDVTVIATSDEPDNIPATPLATGSDGTVIDSDYQTAINTAAQQTAGNVLFLDVYNAARRLMLKVHAADTQDKMVVLAGDDENQTKAEYIADLALHRDADGRIIYIYPYNKTSINSVEEDTSPASWFCSIISQTSPHIDPASVDNTQFLGGVSGLSQELVRSDYIQFMAAGGAAFEFDSDVGFKVKSGVVTQIVNSSKLTILRRRMADFLTNSGGKFLKAFQNKNNSKDNRTAARAGIEGFVKTNSGPGGILPSDAEVKTGRASIVDENVLNSDLSLGQGFFKIKWKQRIFSSMRFIVLQAEIGETVLVTEVDE